MAALLLKGVSIASIDGVLFDKDGTLSHSEPNLLKLAEQRIKTAVDLWSATGDASQSRCLEETLRKAFGMHQSTLHPGGTLAVAARKDNILSTATVFCLFGLTWTEALNLAHNCFEGVDQEFGCSRQPSPLLPDAGKVLQRFQDGGLLNAVISNDTSRGIKDFLDHHQLSSRIASIWSADDIPRKPDPKAVDQLCRRLGFAPQRCALVGDAETDLQMAIDADIGCVIGYTGGWSLPPDLPSAEHLLDHWSDLELDSDT